MLKFSVLITPAMYRVYIMYIFSYEEGHGGAIHFFDKILLLVGESIGIELLYVKEILAPYVGQVAVGRLTNGILEMNKTYSLCGAEKVTPGIKICPLTGMGI